MKFMKETFPQYKLRISLRNGCEIQRLIGVKTWVAVCIPHCIEKNRCHKCGNNKVSREQKREQMRPILIEMQRR